MLELSIGIAIPSILFKTFCLFSTSKLLYNSRVLSSAIVVKIISLMKVGTLDRLLRALYVLDLIPFNVSLI